MIFTPDQFNPEIIKNKKLLSFDSDDTVVISKTEADDEMVNLLTQLLKNFKINIISGTNFERLEKVIAKKIQENGGNIANMTISPNVGTRLFIFGEDGSHTIAYEKGISEEEKSAIINALEKMMSNVKHDPKELWGDIIEDRGTMIAWSAFGGDAPIEIKRPWDPDGSKRRDWIENYLWKDLEEYRDSIDIFIGGTTTIDIAKKGADKAFGVQELAKYFNFSLEDILFFGDKVYDGGNDYPVAQIGVDSIAVKGIEDTKKVLSQILEFIN